MKRSVMQFICSRCNLTEIVESGNQPSKHWITLTQYGKADLKRDEAELHLCPGCAQLFSEQFLHCQAITASRRAFVKQGEAARGGV